MNINILKCCMSVCITEQSNPSYLIESQITRIELISMHIRSFSSSFACMLFKKCSFFAFEKYFSNEEQQNFHLKQIRRSNCYDISSFRKIKFILQRIPTLKIVFRLRSHVFSSFHRRMQ